MNEKTATLISRIRWRSWKGEKWQEVITMLGQVAVHAPMQEVTPRVVAIAVRMEMAMLMMVFHVSRLDWVLMIN